MYKPKKKLSALLDTQAEEIFSKKAINTILRALLEPVAGQNPSCIMFTRLKNKEGSTSLIKRLEYCTNVNMIDVCGRDILIKDNYIELEFVIFNSARYNFALIWDYSKDKDKKTSPVFFAVNSSSINTIFDILQENLKNNYREEFYSYKPERRENELLNDALRNVLKKMNDSIEEVQFSTNENYYTELPKAPNDNIREAAHEIKNQLSILDVYTKILEKKFGSNGNIDIIKKASGIIAFEIGELQNKENAVKDIVLQDVISEAVKMFNEVLAQKNNKIIFNSNYNFDITVFADENRLLSVFNNILKNANESTFDDKIEIDIKLEKGSVFVDITNHGAPINKDDVDFIFQKGFSTKENGMGIGLYSCRRYLKTLKGNLELLTSNREKTTFRVKLPMVE